MGAENIGGWAMQFPHSVWGQGPLLADVAVHPLHGCFVVPENGQQNVGLDVGVFRPHDIGDKPMLQSMSWYRGEGVETLARLCTKSRLEAKPLPRWTWTSL